MGTSCDYTFDHDLDTSSFNNLLRDLKKRLGYSPPQYDAVRPILPDGFHIKRSKDSNRIYLHYFEGNKEILELTCYARSFEMWTYDSDSDLTIPNYDWFWFAKSFLGCPSEEYKRNEDLQKHFYEKLAVLKKILAPFHCKHILIDGEHDLWRDNLADDNCTLEELVSNYKIGFTQAGTDENAWPAIPFNKETKENYDILEEMGITVFWETFDNVE